MRLERLQKLLNSLSEPIRLRLLHLLFARQDRDWDVSAIVEVLGAPQPTVSRHLARLREEGLVDVAARGRRRLYRLADYQSPSERAVLAALEPFVAAAPEAQEDLRRARRFEPDAPSAGEGKPSGLTAEIKHATQWLLDRATYDETEREQEMEALFKALATRRRRRLLDGIQRRPGASLAEVTDMVEGTRQAVRRHVDVLVDASLVHIVEDGRHRRLYYNPVPLQVLYERWTDERSRILARRMVQVKRAVEAPGGADE